MLVLLALWGITAEATTLMLHAQLDIIVLMELPLSTHAHLVQIVQQTQYVQLGTIVHLQMLP